MTAFDMTVGQAFSFGLDFLSENKIENCEFDAKQLLLFVLGLNGTSFLLKRSESVSEDAFKRYKELLEHRTKGEPLQYIIGKWSFLDCEFYVGAGVLIPRPETEQLAQMCIERIKKNNIKVVYDLCSGSGCIGISIAKACEDAVVYLFEKYPAAAEYLKKNIASNNVINARLILCDIFNGIPENISSPQLIVSNPPYIPSEMLSDLQKEVHFEPETALDGGTDGLVFYRAITEKWLNPLSENVPVCLVECGEEQAYEIADMFSSLGETEIHDDIFGVERFVELK